MSNRHVSIATYHVVVLKGRRCRSTSQGLQADGHRRRGLNLCPEGEGRLPRLSSVWAWVGDSQPFDPCASRRAERRRAPINISDAAWHFFWQAGVCFGVALAATRLIRRRRNDASGKVPHGWAHSSTRSEKKNLWTLAWIRMESVFTVLAWYFNLQVYGNINTAFSSFYFVIFLILCRGCPSFDFLSYKVSSQSHFFVFFVISTALNMAVAV